jgi:hypothetical protein
MQVALSIAIVAAALAKYSGLLGSVLRPVRLLVAGPVELVDQPVLSVRTAPTRPDRRRWRTWAARAYPLAALLARSLHRPHPT